MGTAAAAGVFLTFPAYIQLFILDKKKVEYSRIIVCLFTSLY